MLRPVHSFLGLVAALLVVVVTTTGAWLAADAMVERARAPSHAGASVAQIASVAARLPGIERLDRKPSGAIVATYFENDRAAQALIDPATGATAPAPEASPLMVGVQNLHRKLLYGDLGRGVVGVGAMGMLALCLSGLMLLARRLGGWRNLLRPIRGGTAQRVHSELARAALFGLALSALSGVVMSAASFELIADPARARVAAAASAEGPRMAAADMPALRETPLSTFRSLQFPVADDPADVYTLATATGEAALDATTGVVVAQAQDSLWTDIYQTIYALHAGELVSPALFWPLTLILAVSSAAAPVIAGAGALIWLARRRARPRIAGNVAAQSADTILLVGSEGGATWGFAETLRTALTQAGLKVHVGAMNDLAPAYRAARRLILLAATYGEGDAPASASRFLSRLEGWRGGALDAAVLGFGDRAFPAYCAFADQTEQALAARGFNTLTPLQRIDRQSPQAFAEWGRALGAALGLPLDLIHVPERPKTRALRLIERVAYGAEVDAPTVLLRFVATDGGLPRFEAGDLLGVLAPGESVARFYSLGSSRRDGAAEICVRLREGGVCSTFLHRLMVGETLDAFVRQNPRFRPAPGHAPVILIGAGAGVAPLAGFVRANARQRPMRLYFGARHPASDFLYEGEWRAALDERRLDALRPAFSRAGGGYVQNVLAADAETLRALVGKGAQILVCGGRDMARGVVEALTAALAPLGLTVADLKREGRYVEDVY
jgi:sulfite reductase (NADPH) flavoprotein alpha-component